MSCGLRPSFTSTSRSGGTGKEALEKSLVFDRDRQLELLHVAGKEEKKKLRGILVISVT